MNREKRTYNELLRRYLKYVRKRKALIASNKNEHRQTVLAKHIERLYEKLISLKFFIQKKTVVTAVALGAITLMPENANAQGFTPVQINPFGLAQTSYGYNNPTFTDLDNDGDFDLLTGDYYGGFIYYENTGTISAPAYGAAQPNPFGLTSNPSAYFSSTSLVDIDNDGDLDLFSCDYYGDALYYENTGSVSAPAFAAPSANPFGLANVGTYTLSKLTFADLDNDGDFDMIFADDGSSQMFYFENTGSVSAPTFGAPQNNPFGLASSGTWQSPTFVDLDGDGDFDLMVGDDSGDNLYFENTGTASVPAFGPETANPFGLSNTDSYSAMTLEDIDNDGDLDMMVVGSGGDFYYFPGCSPTNGAISPTAVCSFTSPSGNYTWTATGNYTDILTNTAGCDSILTVNLTINSIMDQTVSTTTPSICGASGSVNIDLGGSQSGVDYYLRLNSNDSVVDGPIAGTGSGIAMTTNTISAPTTYNVYGEKLTNTTGIKFNGSNGSERIECGNAANVQLSGTQITLEAWIYPSSWVGINQGHVINKEFNGGIGNDFGYMIRVGNSGDISFNLGDGNWNEIVTTTTPLTLNTWQHVAATYDGSFMRIFVNGNIIDSMATSINFSAPNNNLTIGAWAGGNGSVFDGNIDEPRVWSVARTQGEIQASMNKCLTGSETGLVAYYQLEDGAGSSTAADMSPNSNTGTLMGLNTTTAWSTGSTVCSTCNLEMSQTITIGMGVPSTSNSSITACNDYTSPSGIYTWDATGVYNDTILNASGCDSAMTINLTIDTIVNTVNNSSPTLTADQTGATYRWLDCDNNFAVIAGETGQAFTATASGNYAVEVTVNACVDTSACEFVSMIGISENYGSTFKVYPNPTSNVLNIIVAELNEPLNVSLTSIDGKLIYTDSVNTKKFVVDMSDFSNGIYILRIGNAKDQSIHRITKQ